MTPDAIAWEKGQQEESQTQTPEYTVSHIYFQSQCRPSNVSIQISQDQLQI